jgi:hypothetical protein
MRRWPPSVPPPTTVSAHLAHGSGRGTPSRVAVPPVVHAGVRRGFSPVTAWPSSRSRRGVAGDTAIGRAFSSNHPSPYAHLQELRSPRRGPQLDDPAIFGPAQEGAGSRLPPNTRPLLLLRVHPLRSADRSAAADQPGHRTHAASAPVIPASAIFLAVDELVRAARANRPMETDLVGAGSDANGMRNGKE